MTTEYYTRGFYEERRAGAANSAAAIVPLVLNFVPVRSVVDVGCGEGDWLAAFQKAGVEDILGLDGDHIDRSHLQILHENFQAADFTKPLATNRKFDLAVCLEVAEHLPKACAPIFVDSLVRLAPAVLFSAAIPFQGGVHHINEQWPETWADLFRERNYLAVDLVRKRVWKNETVDWWYAQNTLLFVDPCMLEKNVGLRAEFEQTDLERLSLVHPRKYLELADLPPAPAPSWGVKGASQLLVASFKSAVKRRLASILGKDPIAPQNGNSPRSKS